MTRKVASLATGVSPVWKEGERTLGEIREIYTRFVGTSEEAVNVLTLWTAHTYTFEQRDITPYISLTSAIMREGKTLAMEVAGQMVHRPEIAANISTAALYRVVHSAKPTLFIDETDATSHMTEDYRRILNSGYKSNGYVMRSVGGVPMAFSTYCPKMFAGIGRLPDTIRDRSIEIRMRRPTDDESAGLERFRVDSDLKQSFKAIQSRLYLLGYDHSLDVENAMPELADLGGNARAQDIWEPLWVITDLVGGEWPDMARESAVALMRGEPEDPKTGLLADIRTVFGEHERQMESQVILASVNELPAGEYTRLLNTTRELAQLLRPFDIHPKQIRFSPTRSLRGYRREDFNDAWTRYLDNDETTETPETATSS